MLLRKINPAPVVLSDTQREVAHWQWVILSLTVVLMLLLALVEDPLLRLVQPAAPLNTRQLRMVCDIIPSALACLAVGYLSVRYQVTVVARRLDFWRPTGGSSAVIHGWILVGVGLFILGFLGLETLPFVRLTLPALLICGGGLSVLLSLGMAIRGLRRAFKE